MQARIIILNYNGAELLPQCLPSIAQAAERARNPTAITVLDNLSQDTGLDYVASHFPNIQIEIAPANRILGSYNGYIAKVHEPVVILLNNDIRVEPDFVDPLVDRFNSESGLFMAAPRVMSFDGSRLEAGRSRSGFRWGLFWCDARYPGYEKDELTPSDTFSSGFGAFSREKFLSLGGYDERYFPGIMEDVDLCLRARRAGYTLRYEPRSTVYHMGQASFKKAFGSRRISTIAHRNNFLFMWKNFSGPGFWVQHLLFLPLRLAAAALLGNWGMVLGFWQAIRKKQQGPA